MRFLFLLFFLLFLKCGPSPTSDAAVNANDVVAEQEESVATILTPRSSTQPFSGKRMWGIRTNENGNCEIFTRGIDRAKPVAMVDLIGEIFDGCDDLDYFEIADRTWKIFQTKVFDFIIRNNGVGVIKESRADHIDYKKVYQKLKSNVPVSFVSCQ
jgi:hypothetical protein